MGEAGVKIAVLGAGNFGTVIANIVAARGHEVALWLRDPSQCAALARDRENLRYLPGHPLAEGVVPTTDLPSAVAGARLVFVAVPSAALPAVAERLGTLLESGTGLISTTKGLARDGFMLMSEVLAMACPQARIGVLSGPNLAEEIAQGHFTGTVIASAEAALCEEVQRRVHSRSFRVYSNSDRYGVELAGALKNIYALASGMAAALGAGENSRAMLLTRGLAEMSQFAVAKGANPLTLLGLAGVGDLMVTCSSPLSRNFQLGRAIGEGRSLEDAAAHLGKLAEGVNTVRSTWQEAQRLAVPMPICQGLHAILFEGRQLPEVLVRLMLAEQRDDVAVVWRQP